MFTAIVKPLVRSEMLNKVHFHSSNMNYEKFYKDHIPKSHLPKEYGGELESVKSLHDQQRQILKSLGEYFKLEEMQSNFEFDEYADEVFNDGQRF